MRVREGKSRSVRLPGLFWLGGFKSDMKGTKAAALDDWADAQGRACVRFDYSGHGESGGAFTDGTIGRWLEESVAVYRQFAKGPQVVVGSSMGGWLALLLARRAAQGKGAAPTRRHGADRAGGRLHRRADVEEVSRRHQARDRGEGRLDAAVALRGRSPIRSPSG